MTARIGIVDDHPAILLGTTAILNARDGLHVVATASTVSELLSRGVGLDVVLLDLVLADGTTPAENVVRLTASGIPVIAYTSGDRPPLVREASRAGAAGMVRKSELPEAIIEAVRTVLGGGVVASTDWASALDTDREFVNARLSRREAEVLGLYASGETAERVAALLFITKETVYDHIRRIRAKYAAAARPARTKLDLYHRAVEDGIVPRGR